jgi:hypothetical protein
MQHVRWAEHSYPDLTFSGARFASPKFGSFPILQVTPTPGTFISMIGGPQSFTILIPSQVLVLASGQLFNVNEGATNVAQLSLRVDGAQVEFQQLQVPPQITFQDGIDFSFVFLTGTLTASVHTVDVLINSGAGNGISSAANSGALFFQVQSP